MALGLERNKIFPLRNIISPFNLDTNLDILGLILAAFVGVVGLIVIYPQDSVQWSLKIVEMMGVGFALSAISLLVFKTRDGFKVRDQKTKLELLAKKQGVSLEEHLQEKMDSIIESITKWSDAYKLDYDVIKHSSFRNVINFKEFAVDYIDIKIIDYHFTFTIRIYNCDLISEFMHFLRASKIKVAFIEDKYHLGPKFKIKIDDKGVRYIRSTLVNGILSPVYIASY
jgi:hypothetical protein